MFDLGNVKQWERQPQDIVSIADRWKPFVAQAIVGSQKVSITNDEIITVGTVSNTTTINGIASNHSGGSINMLRTPIYNENIGTNNKGAAFMAIFTTVGTLADKPIGGFGSDSGSSGNTVFAITSGVSDPANLRFLVGNSVNNISMEVAGAIINDGFVHSALVSLENFNSSGSYTVHGYLDGNLVSSNTAATILGNTNVFNWLCAGSIRRTTDLGPGATCQILGVVGFRQRLPIALAVEITKNPWQLFEPRRTITPVSWNPDPGIQNASIAHGPYPLIERPKTIRNFKKTTSTQPSVPVINQSNYLAEKACAIALPVDNNVKIWAKSGKFEEFATFTGSGLNIYPAMNANRGIGPSSGLTTNTCRLHSVANQFDTVWEKPQAQGTWAVVLVRYGNNTFGNAGIYGNLAANTAPYTGWGISDGSGTGTAEFSCGAGSLLRIASQVGWLDNNIVRTFVGRYDGAQLTGWRDGVLGPTTACTGNITYPNGADRGPHLANMYNFTTNARSFNGRIFLAVLWDVALSDNEIREFCANPWQIFETRMDQEPYPGPRRKLM